jgi:hypothetical protein
MSEPTYEIDVISTEDLVTMRQMAAYATLRTLSSLADQFARAAGPEEEVAILKVSAQRTAQHHHFHASFWAYVDRHLQSRKEACSLSMPESFRDLLLFATTLEGVNPDNHGVEGSAIDLEVDPNEYRGRHARIVVLLETARKIEPKVGEETTEEMRPTMKGPEGAQ